MRLAQILEAKGAEVVTTRPDTTIAQAVALLVDHNIGAVVVVEEEGPVGILSERDLLRFLAGGPPDLVGTRVSELMTAGMVTGTPYDRVSRAMTIMTEQRIRHLPILDAGRLVGIVSIGDLVNALRKAFEEENVHLKAYISTAG
jgi:CBS domain-containing protein